MLRGVGWLFIQGIGARLVGLVSQIALARLLVPNDFGLFGLAGTVGAVVGMLADFGLQDVVLQRQKAVRYWITSAFWASVVLGFTGMLVTLIVAPLASRIYSAPELLPILSIIALSLLVGAPAVVPTILMRAHLQFRQLAIWATLEIIATQALTVALAFSGLGAYSFVIPLPVIALARSVLFWRLTRPRVGALRVRRVKQLLSRGVSLFGARIVTTMVSQGDYFALGLVASKSVVGAYYFGFKLAVQPLQLIGGSVTGVVFPVLAQMGRDQVRQRAAAISATRALAFVAMPCCFLQAALAEPILHLIVGHKWDSAIPIVQLLSIGLGFDAIAWIAGALLRARGEFTLAFRYSVISAIMFFLAAFSGALLGSDKGVAVALCVALYYALVTPWYSVLAFRQVGISTLTVLGIYLLPATLALSSVGAGHLVASKLQYNGILRICTTSTVGVVLYLVAVRVFVPGAWVALQSTLRAVTRRPAAATGRLGSETIAPEVIGTRPEQDRAPTSGAEGE